MVLLITLVVLSAIVGLTLAVRYLGYAKLAAASRMLLSGRFGRIIDAETRLADLERRLKQAIDIDDCWAQLCAGSVEFGFKGVRMAIDETLFEDPGFLDSERLWQLRVPLQNGRYIDFLREFSCMDPPISSTFANSIERGLSGWFAAQVPEVPRKSVAAQGYFTAGARGNAGAR